MNRFTNTCIETRWIGVSKTKLYLKKKNEITFRSKSTYMEILHVFTFIISQTVRFTTSKKDVAEYVKVFVFSIYKCLKFF